ncbi:unnamed protein product, partial [Rotaria sordida]
MPTSINVITTNMETTAIPSSSLKSENSIMLTIRPNTMTTATS